MHRKSWSLEDFVADYGITGIKSVWMVRGKSISRQAVEQAIDSDREIRVVLTDDLFEVHEYKMLSQVKESSVSLRRANGTYLPKGAY